jgi:hypothetical protein
MLIFVNIFRTRKKFNSPFAPGMEVDAKLFVVTHDSKLLISAGHWDNSLQVYHIGKGRRISHICRHIGNGLYFVILSHTGREPVSGQYQFPDKYYNGLILALSMTIGIICQ